MSGPVIVSDAGKVRTLTLTRPAVRNAFDHDQWRGFTAALEAASKDDGVSVVVITGAPGAFTAGQDLAQMAPPADGSPHPSGAAFDVLMAFDKPLIAAVNGVAVGFGVTMLLHCDIVIVATSARLRAPFVSLGVVPEAASTVLLPAAVGPQHSAEVLFTAEWISSERAVEMGLALRAVADPALSSEVAELAARIAVNPMGSLRHTKRLLLAARADAVAAARKREDEIFARRAGSPENREAIRAFVEKRPPDFSNIAPD
jgi:enoyl-CoA hydratase/carnithine racemase